MAAYATAAQFRALHPDVDAADESVGAALSMVSAAIGALCDESSVDAEVLSLVACNAAARALMPGGPGVQSQSWGASPFSGSVTYANPSGDVYLTAFEKRLLGIDGADMEAAWANPIPEGWS